MATLLKNSWHVTYLKIAELIGEHSKAERKKVGAILVKAGRQYLPAITVLRQDSITIVKRMEKQNQKCCMPSLMQLPNAQGQQKALKVLFCM